MNYSAPLRTIFIKIFNLLRFPWRGGAYFESGVAAGFCSVE
jgi:hypothetical protein